MTNCFYCNSEFPDYEALAKHISTSKKGHRKGKRWAANYLMKARQLNSKKSFNPTPLTQEDRENRASTLRELSGEINHVLTVCPICKKGHREQLPTEFTESSQAWRTDKGTLIVSCAGCQH